MRIFVFGSSILSSYWNGAATYYRGMYKYLARRGHEVTFAEPDAFDRLAHVDQVDLSFVKSLVYRSTNDLNDALNAASEMDVIVKHSGIGINDVLLEKTVPTLGPLSIFWDVDAPATLAQVRGNAGAELRSQIKAFDAIFTYGGGPRVEAEYLQLGAKHYSSFYNALDPETHHPVVPLTHHCCDLAFLGNRLPDREERVDELFFSAALLAPEKSFLLGGEGWGDKRLPKNVRWMGHVSTSDHNGVNSSARMVLNVNRTSMAETGFSPPTRIFEVAGAGTCLLCDFWPGIDSFFEPDRELLVVRTGKDVADILMNYHEDDLAEIGSRFRLRALREHTYAQRAKGVEEALNFLLSASKGATAGDVVS